MLFLLCCMNKVCFLYWNKVLRLFTVRTAGGRLCVSTQDLVSFLFKWWTSFVFWWTVKLLNKIGFHWQKKTPWRILYNSSIFLSLSPSLQHSWTYSPSSLRPKCLFLSSSSDASNTSTITDNTSALTIKTSTTTVTTTYRDPLDSTLYVPQEETLLLLILPPAHLPTIQPLWNLCLEPDYENKRWKYIFPEPCWAELLKLFGFCAACLYNMYKNDGTRSLQRTMQVDDYITNQQMKS